MSEYQSKGQDETGYEGRKYKPGKQHPWRKFLTTEQHKWAHEQSKLTELAIKQPMKFKKRS